MFFVLELLLWYAMLFVAARWGKKEGLATFAVTAAIIANMETSEFVNVMGFSIPGGSIPFACLFLATDISSELYGRRFSQNLVMRIGLSLLASSVILAVFGLQSGISDSFRDVHGASLRIAVSSILVYYLSGWIDVRIYHVIGKRCPYKWLRNNASTITSQLVNAFCFIVLAFGWIGLEPIMGNWLLSLVLALIDTPMVYLITGRDRKLDD